MKRNWFSHVLVTLLIAYLLMPILAICLYSVSLNWTRQMLPSEFTLDYYRELFSLPDFYMAIVRSVGISLVSVAICVLILLLAMYVVLVYKPHWEKYVNLIVTIPYAVSGVILATSLLSLYAAGPWPLSNRLVMLTFAYCIVILPYVYQGIRNALYAVNVRQLLEVAEILRCPPLRAFFAVIVPNIFSGITISSLLAISIVFGDFVLVKTIAGTSYFTMQYYLFNAMLKSGTRGGAVVFVAFLITLAISFLALKLQEKGQKQRRQET